ncbi:MAG: hypothetical protein ABR555_06125 [Pyrinomonadaceae bacterium]
MRVAVDGVGNIYASGYSITQCLSLRLTESLLRVSEVEGTSRDSSLRHLP